MAKRTSASALLKSGDVSAPVDVVDAHINSAAVINALTDTV